MYKVMKDCNLSSNSFTVWNSRKQRPNIDALIKIANYFNVSLDYLVGRETLPVTRQENQRNTTYDVTTAPLLNKWNTLTESQRKKVLTYIDDITGSNNATNPVNIAYTQGDAAGQRLADTEGVIHEEKKYS